MCIQSLKTLTLIEAKKNGSKVGSANRSVTATILRVCLGQGFEVCLERGRGINNIWNGKGV